MLIRLSRIRNSKIFQNFLHVYNSRILSDDVKLNQSVFACCELPKQLSIAERMTLMKERGTECLGSIK